MTVTTTLASNPFDPFDAMRREWKALCAGRRHTQRVTHWVVAEPTLAEAGVRRLADVVPPAGTDYSVICAAVGRLHQAGDDLAARALLQLLLPGLIDLASRHRHRFGGSVNDAGAEIISLAGIYLARLRGPINCSPAGYVLWSIHRDLVKQSSADARPDVVPMGWPAHLATVDPVQAATSLSVDKVWHQLGAAVRDGSISRYTAQVIWLDWAGWPPNEATRYVPYSASGAYRLRADGYAQLRDLVDDGVVR